MYRYSVSLHGRFSFITSSFIKEVNNHFKIGLLITFHYHSIACHCHIPPNKLNISSPRPFVQMGDTFSTDSKSAFVGNEDRYKGVHIKSVEEPCDTSSFASKLEVSLESWKTQKMRSAWFFVNLSQADWVPVLAKNGFRFHHAKDDEVAMVRWLSPEESRIPVFAHTMVGAGAVVVNNEGKLLVVQERFRGAPFWKLPGGYVEPGEDIPDAAMREVLEETNIKTEFRSMLAFRHAHGGPFGCSDIYFIVELAPKSDEITSCEFEIEDSQWMDINTYLNHPDVHENNRLFVRKYLFSKEKGLAINGTKTKHPVTKAPQMLYALGEIEEANSSKL